MLVPMHLGVLVVDVDERSVREREGCLRARSMAGPGEVLML